MFKKIQNYLLLHHPILWNTKVVPMLAIMLALHIIFFIIGYVSGAVDFSEANVEYDRDNLTGVIVFFGIFISIIIAVIWLVLYFRNNSFKSFYPKSNNSLYKEWITLLFICIINFSYVVSFMYAQDLRARNYFSEEEFLRRTDIISMASLFADGAFQEIDEVYVERNGESVLVKRDSFEYNKRNYSLKSLMNKAISDFTYQSYTRDSLNEVRVKRWLAENKKDSVLWVMREFDKIAKGHGAKSNITPEKWLSLVYDYPEFTNYVTVGRAYRYGRYEDIRPYQSVTKDDNVYAEVVPDEDAEPIDTISNEVRKMNDGYFYVFPKNYVPLRQVEHAYGEISNSWDSPIVDETTVIFILYLGLGLSLLIFSFRVTSGRSWLIAIVAFGITGLVTGFLNIVLAFFVLRGTYRRYDEEFYFLLWLLIIAATLIYFLKSRKSKGISAIILNILLWLTPWVLPVIGVGVKTYFNATAIYENGERISPVSPFEAWTDEHEMLYLALCVLAYLIFMYFFTNTIKKWKALPEA